MREAVYDRSGDRTNHDDRDDLEEHQGGEGDSRPADRIDVDDQGNIVDRVAQIGDDLAKPHREIAGTAGNTSVAGEQSEILPHSVWKYLEAGA